MPGPDAAGRRRVGELRRQRRNRAVFLQRRQHQRFGNSASVVSGIAGHHQRELRIGDDEKFGRVERRAAVFFPARARLRR